MKVAVTGVSGRVGSAIAREAIARGFEVVGIDQHTQAQGVPGGVLFVQAALADFSALRLAMEGCDALIHMAAIPSPRFDPAHVVHNNNVVASYNALSAAAELGILKVVQASSVNAIGLSYSREPRFDYLPLDEDHPTYNEDAYSLSKWICEAQADSIVRRNEAMTIASLRFHWVVDSRDFAVQGYRDRSADFARRQLWAYTSLEAAVRASLLGIVAPFKGHGVFNIVAPRTAAETDSAALVRAQLPGTPIRGQLTKDQGFYDCAKAARLLGWLHDK